MTQLLIFIKHHCPWIWQMVESVNGRLFALLHPTLRHTAAQILGDYAHPQLQYSLMTDADAGTLADFLDSQPKDSFTYFNPHDTDRATLKRLLRNPAFLMMKITRRADGRMTGYFFLRCFFIGRAFHGLIVDAATRNLSQGTSMWALSQRICQACGLRMFATIAAVNGASLHSARKGTSVNVIKRMANGYLLIECTRKQL